MAKPARGARIRRHGAGTHHPQQSLSATKFWSAVPASPANHEQAPREGCSSKLLEHLFLLLFAAPLGDVVELADIAE